MQTTSPMTAASPIQMPEIDIDGPVAVIPVASAAPLDGPPDGERINTFALAPKNDRTLADSRASAVRDMRDHVLRKPLASMAAAFSLGLVLGRLLR